MMKNSFESAQGSKQLAVFSAYCLLPTAEF
jgi:hypothetical protein